MKRKPTSSAFPSPAVDRTLNPASASASVSGNRDAVVGDAPPPTSRSTSISDSKSDSRSESGYHSRASSDPDQQDDNSDADSDAEFNALFKAQDILHSDADSDSDIDLNSNSDADADADTNYMSTNLPGVIPRLRLPSIDPVYESDTSDDDYENTVGNIPLEWYNDYDHIGYNINGQKILKSGKGLGQGDELDKFLDRIENPDSWHSVYDALHGRNVVLSPEDLQLIKNIQEHKLPNASADDFVDLGEWFTRHVEVMPLSAAPEPKRRFIPSKWEGKRIMHIVRGIRAGRITVEKPTKKPKHYDLWSADGQELAGPMYMPAPKMKLPGNEESYNPPSEYLFTDQEKEQWENTDPSDRKIKLVPQKFSALRSVPSFPRFVHERFERCLDLYLCPRTVKKRLNIDPESLLPTLPDLKDLEPYPKFNCLTYSGHKGRVRGINVDPTGQWLASCGEDGTARVWEVETGRCISIHDFNKDQSGSDADNDISVKCVDITWNPNKALRCFAVTLDSEIRILVPGLNDASNLDAMTLETLHSSITTPQVPQSGIADWTKLPNGIKVTFPQEVKHLSWHRKGDYFCTVTNNSTHTSTLIHRISTTSTQCPFKKSRGLIQKTQFHPSKPFLFVANQTTVRIYNLEKQIMNKKLMSGVKWISSIDIHPGGDNVVVGSYDKRVVWWDLDLGDKPYKTMRNSSHAVRALAFHAIHPLLACATDSGDLQIYHSQVHADLMTNPTIIPVKVIRAHEHLNGLGSLNVAWHPKLPWCFTSGENDVKLWC